MSQSMTMSDVAESNGIELSPLFKEHSSRAYSFAYRLTGNEHYARELVQQAFTNALKHFGAYDRSRPFAPWLNRILKNIFLDGLRQAKIRRTVSLDNPSPIEDVTWEQLLPGPDCTPLEHMEKVETNELVQKALNILPPVYKTVVTMSDMDRMSYKNIAETLGCPIGTVRSRIHLGRVMLRKTFDKVSVNA